MGRLVIILLAATLLGIAPPALGADLGTARATCDTPVAMSFIDGPLCERPALLAPSAASGQEIRGTNADGTQFRVTYFPSSYATPAEADASAQLHLAAIMAAYANETSWGFASADPDRILDLTLDGCDCIYSGYEANIHMFPRVSDIYPLLPGLAYRNDAEAAELISGHELFHHMQYSVQQWRLGGWLVEGMARFSETANVPDATFLPTALTFWPNDNGMNGFVLDPARSISGHSYDWSLVWGYLYANEGGMPLLKAVLEETAAGPAFGDANQLGPAAIQRAMDRVPGGAHATFEAAYRDLARALVTHEGFVWGAPDGSLAHDWSTYFEPVGRIRSTQGSWTLPQWGIRYHDATQANASTPALLSYAGGPSMEASVYERSGTTRSFASAQPANVLQGVDDAALLVVRVAASAGEPTGATARYALAMRH